MTQPALAAAVLAAALITYGVLGVAWWSRDRADRRAAAHLGSREIDPYHAAATARWPERADRVAAAELIRGGTVSIDDEGFLTVTERCDLRAEGSTYRPEHPVPVALLDALTRHGGRATLRGLAGDPPLQAAREAFLCAEGAKFPRWADRREDGLRTLATSTVLLVTLFYAVQVIFLREALAPHGVLEAVFSVAFLVVLWLMLAVPTGWFVLRYWPDRRDHFDEHCARLPEHPALAALAESRRAALIRSADHQEPWEVERYRWVDVDSPGPD
ncbi:hypothetical protein ABZ371_16390 [Streptomyces sp. NPDC005899]|uniref:hypothetical protein n=1 Tax=Streptomyces sp. NPDC005899 TaxID=3155716 RepID=UPI0033DA23AD